MKLSIIEFEHLEAAAQQMDRENDKSWAEYWIQFANGKEYQFKQLVRRAYEVAAGHKVETDFFQSNESYRLFIVKKFGVKIIFKVPGNVSFFEQNELRYFSRYAGKPYRTVNSEHERVGKKLKQTVYNKTSVWARLLNLEGYAVELDNRWQISGYFKSYTWARVFRPEYKASMVYFTVGVHSDGSLVYKMDCQRSQFNKGKALLPRQIAAFDRLLNGTGADWRQISIGKVPGYDWESLREMTAEFIVKYDLLYGEAVQVVNNAFSQPEPTPGLTEGLQPKGLKSIPTKKYTFQGSSPDYDAENKNAKKIGDGGESLVIELERNQLIKAGKPNLAAKVGKVLDGEGFDINSFHPDGRPKYIEVKTTVGPNSRPFIMSDNEWEFMKKNSNEYWLYRVYNYDRKIGSGKYFVLTGNLEDQTLTRLMHFEVFIKDNEI